MSDLDISVNLPIVAPHVGAWIEILQPSGKGPEPLKVAPHVGAWIEILKLVRRLRSTSVAPHVGAWIEIHYRPQM